MINIISKDFRYPNKDSKKKRWYYTIECPNCGKIEEKIYSNNFVNLCGHCSKGGYTTKEFIIKAVSVHGSTYDYTKTTYTNKRTNVAITCKIHGEFTQRPSEHLGGNGCKKCASYRRGRLLRRTDSTIENIVSNYKEVKLNSQDVNNVYLTCHIHGDFTKKKSLLYGKKYLCDKCSDSHPQIQATRTNLVGKKCSLYYVYLPDIDMYKLGITVQDIKKRLGSLNYTIIWVDELEYSEAIKIEYSLKIKYLEYQYRGTTKLIKNGSFECYHKNIIPNKLKSYNS